MKLDRNFSLLLAAAILCGASVTVSRGQQAPTPAIQSSNGSGSASSGAAAMANHAPITEDALRARYMGKMVFLRGDYMGDDLQFDENGKANGSPATTSFTLSALEVRKVSLTKHKLEIEADRYGLHFFGVLPFEDVSEQPYDKVKISKKPVRISIERELVVVPKVKKEKKKDEKSAPQAPKTGPAPVVTASATPITPDAVDVRPGTTTSPAHSAMLLDAALDNVLATSIDQRMMVQLPDYWQEYFKSRNEHRQFTPANVQAAGEGVTPPKVLNSIDPSSNEYAQKYGIAGLTLFRTVVDASGKPEQIAIVRPIGFGLDEQAVAAIKTSRFTPAVEHGHPVPAVIDVVVTFRIYSNRTKPGSVPKGSKPTEVLASAWDSGNTPRMGKALQ